jgi:TolB-like protein/Flp pilus assembly protein TadD
MMNRIETLLGTARQRQLDRFAAAYAVGGWLLVQAASIALPAFDAPAWSLRWLIVVTIVGFPLVLIGGWMLNRQSAATGTRAALNSHEAIFLVLIGLVSVLSLGELAWHWSAAAGQSTQNAASAAPAGSVAVLPFDNMSADSRQKYFSEGISAEIINLLARNPALHVTARTSAFFFEGKSQDIREIARKLNVRTILEGSVSSDAGRVHIDAALVDAADGYQLWSQSYNRSLSDILAVQSEIAGAIAQALAPTLTGIHPSPSVPKPIQIDPNVYRDYLQAQFYFDQRLGEGETAASRAAVATALALFRKVAAAAPDFADGQAALAYALLYSENDTEFETQIHQALQRALARDPENPEALGVALAESNDWDTKIKYALILKRGGVRTAAGAFGLGDVYFDFGLTDNAVALYRQWATLDPFSFPAWHSVVNAYFADANYADAVSTSDQALALHPNDPTVLQYRCVSLTYLHRIAEAKAALAVISQPGIPKQLATHCHFFIVLNGEGDKAAIAYVHSVVARDPNATGGAGDTGFMLSHTSAIDEAMDYYEKSLRLDHFVFGFYPGKSAPQTFLNSPRWIAFTQEPKYRAWAAARDRAEREL